jgi:hypothetical protein
MAITQHRQQNKPTPMAKPTYFWKDVISPAVLFVREQKDDGSLGGVHVCSVPPKRIEHFYQQTKRMLACSLSIPIPLEHGEERAMDERSLEAHRLLHNTGWVVDCRMKDGSLQHKLRIDRPDVARGLENGTIKMVSPLIEPTFMDGKGRVWHDVIVQDALTNKAVQQPQGEFRVAASAKSGSIPALPDKFRGILCRATALSVPTKGGSMAGELPDNDADDDEGGEGDGKLDIGSSGGAGEAAKQPAAALPIGMDRPVSKDLVDSLARHNLYVPEDCRLSMLEDMLMVSLNTSAMSQGLFDDSGTVDQLDETDLESTDDDNSFDDDDGFDEGDDDPENPRKKKTAMTEESLTVPLSTPRGIIGEPARSKYAATGAHKAGAAKKPEQVKLSIALQRNAFNGFRRDMVGKLDELRDNGQIMPSDHVELVNQVNSAKLSLAQDGNVTESVGIALSVKLHSKIPKGTFWTDAERTSQLTEHRMPSSMLPANDMTRDEAASIVDDAFGTKRQ